MCRLSPVAPRAGARIETKEGLSVDRQDPSPLVQGRGLKRSAPSSMITKSMSPLVQGRGLKPPIRDQDHSPDRSPLVQGRGLKHVLPGAARAEAGVAPRAGARIETIRHVDITKWYQVAPRAGARIETSSGCAAALMMAVAPRAGARIETCRTGPPRRRATCRPSCRGAD